MARQAQAEGRNEYNQATGVAGQGGANAQSAFQQLFPTYARMARGENTPGLTAANTAAQQSAGGAMSGLFGQANAQAARSGNAGGYGAALDKAAEQGGKNLTEAAAQVKAQGAEQGLQGLQGLYGGALGQQKTGLTAEDEGLQNQLAAGQQGWFQNVLGGLNAAANLAGAVTGGKGIQSLFNSGNKSGPTPQAVSGSGG